MGLVSEGRAVLEGIHAEVRASWEVSTGSVGYI